MTTLAPDAQQHQQPTTGHDQPCHLLDTQNRALCFADLSGRKVHSLAICREQGHPTCPTCEAIYRTLQDQQPGTGSTSSVHWHT